MDLVSYQRRYEANERLVGLVTIEHVLRQETLFRCMIFGQLLFSYTSLHLSLLSLWLQAANGGRTITVDVGRLVSCLLQKYRVALVVLIVFSCRRFVQSTYCQCLTCFQTMTRRTRRVFHKARKERERIKKAAAVKIQCAVRCFLAQKLAERLRAERKLAETAVKDIQVGIARA